MAWEFETEPEYQHQLDWVEAYVRSELFALEALLPELSQTAIDAAVDELRRPVRERGLWAAHLGPEFGGSGFGQVKLGLLHELLGMSPIAPAVFGVGAPDSGNSEILAVAGTAIQKQRYLEPLLAGRLRSAFSMTELDTAGSDPTLLRTTARRVGDGWVLNGRKWFTTNGSRADFLIVVAVTDPSGPPHREEGL